MGRRWEVGWGTQPALGSFRFLLVYLFTCLHWAFVVAHRLSLAAAIRDYSSLGCSGFSSLWFLSLRMEHRLQGCRFQ